MNKVRLSALSALACLSIGMLSVHGKVVSHLKGNGAYASFSGYDASGRTNLYVGQSVSGQSSSTYLDYYDSDCDYEAGICQGTSAYGPIPNGDFNPSVNSATLNTNISALPDFRAVRWTYNINTYEYSETPISLGVLSISWKKSGQNSSRYIGTSTTTYYNTTWKTTGQSTWSDAVVSGTIEGQPVEALYGNFGTNSNNEITRERN